MGTCRPVRVHVDASRLVEIIHSVAAHLSAKLEAFHSDERTLTDELCDMLTIWAAMSGMVGPTTPGHIHLIVQKLTPADERRRGADLEVVLATPDGVKTALFQAKVVDPATRRLRGAGKQSEARLRRQLKDAESAVGADLTFLLAYIPWGLMDGRTYAFPTWEQAIASRPAGIRPSYLGASVIALPDLARRDGRWRGRPNFRDVGQLDSGLQHRSLARVLLELAVCRRGPSRGN